MMTDLSLYGFIGGTGPMEMLVVGVIAVLLFGHRLPSVMRNLGRGAREFREGLNSADEPQNQEAIS